MLRLFVIVSVLFSIAMGAFAQAPATDPNQQLNELQRAQLEQAKLQNRKLEEDLRYPVWLSGATIISGISAVVALGGFWFGLIRYGREQAENRRSQQEQAEKQVVANERDLMKPWLESQREIYLEALAAVATVANSDPGGELRRGATQTFWELYHGKMILVESQEVSGAMVDFGNCIEQSAGREVLNKLSKVIATAMAESMAETARLTYDQFAARQFKYS